MNVEACDQCKKLSTDAKLCRLSEFRVPERNLNTGSLEPDAGKLCAYQVGDLHLANFTNHKQLCYPCLNTRIVTLTIELATQC